MSGLTLLDAITAALAHELEHDPDVLLFGEDIGLNGGVFRATQGLQARFGERRVFDTPLAEGLLAARDLVVRERVRDRARRPLVVLLTDGRATGGPDPLGRSRSAAARLVAEGAAAVVVDCETSYVRLGLAGELAAQLDAPVLQLDQLRADYLAQAVRRAA